MKKLKKPTVGILMATLIFSNVQLYLIYATKVAENINNQVVVNDEKDIKHQDNYSEGDEKK